VKRAEEQGATEAAAGATANATLYMHFSFNSHFYASATKTANIMR